MSVVYVNTYGSRASLSSQRLTIEVPCEDDPDGRSLQQSVPLLDVTHLVINTGVSLPAKTLARLSSRGISVLIVTRSLEPLVITLPARQGGRSRWSQFKQFDEVPFRLQMVKLLVRGKMRNQYRRIQRLSTSRKISRPSELALIRTLAEQLDGITDPSQAFGIEGMASSHYFKALGMFFPDEIPFEHRSRRPPHNPANALLSFLYTLLSMECAAHLWASGLDPAWGFLHANGDDRYALALDMVEPFRPQMDGLALNLLNHRHLVHSDFEQTGGGWYLAQSARPKLFKQFEDHMERSYQSRQLGHQTTLRKHLIHQCGSLKKAILGTGEFEPMRPN